MARNRSASAFYILTMAIFCAGCNKSGLERVRVVGDATFEGHKILNGSIQLEPRSGTSGPTSIAPIVDGKFNFERKGGVPLGTHRVVLQAFIIEDIGAAAGGADYDPLSHPARGSSKKLALPIYRFGGRDQFLPPEYNKASPLIINITGDDDPQVEDFNMKSSKS